MQMFSLKKLQKKAHYFDKRFQLTKGGTDLNIHSEQAQQSQSCTIPKNRLQIIFRAPDHIFCFFPPRKFGTQSQTNFSIMATEQRELQIKSS